MLREAAYYSKMALGLAAWTRLPVPADPFGLVQHNLRSRETNFLQLIRTAIFDNPASPYHTLFQWAGCTHGDLESTVWCEGLEATLQRLYEAGVYLTHDEMKGKTPVRRGAHQLEFDPAALGNPSFAGEWETSSAGSRSRGSVTRRSREYQLYREAQELVLLSPHEIDRRANVTLAAILPATGGIRRVVSHYRAGAPVEAWFPSGQERGDTQHYRAMTAMLVQEMRLLGLAVVSPSYLPHNDYTPAARWIAEQRAAGRLSVVTGGVSPGVRVADAALAAGLDIRDTLFVIGGEALTDAKLEVFRRAGCEARARYTVSEMGQVGIGCREMDGNCVHLSMDAVAVISRKKTAPLSNVEVDSLMHTSLLPMAATVVINAESDDAGILGPARCGCKLRAMGFDRQLDRIFSYGKLTGHNLTLVQGDILELLERHLPARFGGAPTDFQLVEHEGSAQTELELRVDPRLGVRSTEEVREFVIGRVRQLWGGALTAATWKHNENFRVVFAEPYLTGERKVLPLHLIGTSGKKT